MWSRGAILGGVVVVGVLAAGIQSAVTAAEGRFKTITYSPDRPVVLVERDRTRLAFKVEPARALYRAGELPEIRLDVDPPPGATLRYEVRDGFRRPLAGKSVEVNAMGSLPVDMPSGHGYYEVVGTLEHRGDTLAEVRRSFGVLPPPPKPVGDEPFGLWIQGDDHYPELGVRWTRDGVNWYSWERSGEAYLKNRRDLYDLYREQGMRVIAYPKRVPKPFKKARVVIHDTPEAWAALEDWWTTMVKSLAGHVDAWGVINEPMRGMFEGDNDLILRYWALMRKIVDRHDPKTPVLGPSLNPNDGNLAAQYRELLDGGFARYIDIIEMHTYTDSPDDGEWIENSRETMALTRGKKGRELPLWSTEHGASADYDGELDQAQYLMRSWLEAKRMGYPVMIWHMFSHPQGTDQREVQFGIFRNIADQSSPAPPQPRPAGLAYGVMTRQLAGAAFRRNVEGFGDDVRTYAFERNGEAMLALWSTGDPTAVTLPVDGKQPTVTGLFGRVDRPATQDGKLRLALDGSPQFVAPVPEWYLRRSVDEAHRAR